jgi:hypothetical protein
MRTGNSVRYLAPLFAVLMAGCGAVGHAASGSPAAQSLQPSAAPTTSAATTLVALRQRPLNLPAVASAAACPVTASHDLHPVINAPKGAPGFGYGNGPVYASGFIDLYPTGFDNEVWLIEPNYAGPVLVRGRQVDGQQAVLFAQPITFPGSAFLPAGPAPGNPLTTLQIIGDVVPFYSELDLPAASGGADGRFWRMFFGRTNIGVPGCYGFQVDGLTFSETLIFHVRDAARPAG